MTIFDLLADPDKKNKHVLKMLLMHHLEMSKESLVMKQDFVVDPDTLSLIEKDYRRFVEDKEPLEYIMGYVTFAHKKFFLDARTLIPRPETEYMIEAVKEWILEFNQPFTLLDIGTGCGVLGISSYLVNPALVSEFYLCDYFATCLEVAKKNMQHHLSAPQQKNCSLIQSNLLEGYIQKTDPHNRSILIVANLPYIPEKTFDDQAEDNVKLREPRPAFVGGDDGLIYYRDMFAQVQHAREKGLMTAPITMFLEMMTWQVALLQDEFGEWIDFEEVKTFHFQIRIVKAVIA